MTLFPAGQDVADRIIHFEAIENARDLGGLVMQDGRKVRPGLLIRSGNLSHASDSDVAVLKERFNLANVFDFRFDEEESDAHDRRIEGVSYVRLSTLPQRLIDGFMAGRADGKKLKSKDFVENLVNFAFMPHAQQVSKMMYTAIVSEPNSQMLYGMFLHGVLNARAGVLWHCSQGKDRAGWATAFILTALGASRETIEADFDLSNRYFAPFLRKMVADVTGMGGGEREKEFLQAMVGVSLKNFRQALDMIEGKYGSLQAYVEKALGFSKAEQRKLQKKYLTS